MGLEFAAERRLLSQNEMDFVESSHYPVLEDLPRPALLELARWLRGQHDKARGLINDLRRLRRGKAEPRAAAAGDRSERGLAAKKQIFARALKRVNARIDQLDAEAKRARTLAAMRAALSTRQGRGTAHPEGGPTARQGMRAAESGKRRPIITGGRVGSVSQAGKVHQAIADARG